MMKSIVLAAGALLTLGLGSAFAAQQQNVHGTWFVELPGQFAHPPTYTGPAPVNTTDHGTWFVELPGQFAHPPTYTSPAPANSTDHGTWFIELPGQFARPRYH